VTDNGSYLALLSPLVLLVLLSGPVIAQTPIYKYVDENGQTVFTDQPPANGSKAESVEIDPINSSVPPTVDKERSTPSIQRKNSAVDYQTVITSPGDGDTIPMGPGNFSVSAALSPPLSANERVRLIVDGITVGEAQRQPVWQLNNVFRGEHKLVVERLKGDDEVVHRSTSSSVFVLRPSIR
jgi:hypothetical protein